MTSRSRRIEVERIAQAAALEDLAVFYEAIQRARIAAEKAARYIGGQPESRFERVMAAVAHGQEQLPEISLECSAVTNRAGHRLVEPLLELRPRPDLFTPYNGTSEAEYRRPMVEALRMRENGATWRQVRDVMLRPVAS